LQQRNYRQ